MGPERPMRDNHGNPLPGSQGSERLTQSQVDQALAWLPGWHTTDSVLIRQVPVARHRLESLYKGVRDIVEDPGRLKLDVTDEGLLIMLGARAGSLTGADLETAARIDAVISGSDTDPGRSP